MSAHLIECGLAPLVDFHPGHVSSAVFAGLRKLHPSKAVTSNTAPKAAGQFAPSVRLRCKRRGHLPFRRQERPPTRPLRGESRPKEFPALEVGFYRFAAKELRPQTRSRIVLWPPSRQGYFAPASRDAILLDGTLPATISPALTLFLHISSGTKGRAFISVELNTALATR